MNTFFISTYSKKDLQRIKKLLKRNGIEFTLNSKQLFIIAWDRFDLDWIVKEGIGKSAVITSVKLHDDHPLLKQNNNTEYLTPLPFAT